MQIFVQRDGVEQGPYSPEIVRSLLRAGSLLPLDQARYEDVVEWTPLKTLLGIEHVTEPGPRTSKLAVWSLILGVLGIISLGIASIAAIICGHLSQGKIRKSRGELAGKGIAKAGLILGYLGLILWPILIAAGFAAGNAAITKANRTIAMATAIAIESAVNNFYTEYGAMPSETVITDTSKDVSLVKTLRGADPARNPRNIRFLSVKESKQGKNGLDPVTFKIFDPWDHGYQVFLDTRYTEEVTVTRGGITETLKRRRVAVFSLGKDGVAGTADDVRTW
ncbi:MAG: DUF4190 domain-containing protein [Luteolibacter sp.]